MLVMDSYTPALDARYSRSVSGPNSPPSSRAGRRIRHAPYPPSSSYSPVQSSQQIIIPSNVYAPQTLPLHTPQPMACFPSLATMSSAGMSSQIPSLSQNTAPPITTPALHAQYPGASVPPPNTFPTPCELLNDLTARDAVDCNQKGRRTRRRKVQQEAIANTLGYIPTDPDTISSHDKKRYYLDCIEQYVLYLHNQLRLVGAEPVPLERVSSGRGLTSRSIRTMLVHMQKSAGRLHLQRQEAEERVYKQCDTRGHNLTAAIGQMQLQAMTKAPDGGPPKAPSMMRRFSESYPVPSPTYTFP